MELLGLNELQWLVISITCSGILKYLRRRALANAYILPEGKAEVVELFIEENENTQDILGKKLSDLKIPKECIICCIARDSSKYVLYIDCIILWICSLYEFKFWWYSCAGRSGFGHPTICHVSQFDSSALFTDFIGIRSKQSKTFKSVENQKCS